MPKLYEYHVLIVLFYSNEHEPVHVHGRKQGRETKAEFVIEQGRVLSDRTSDNHGADQVALVENAFIDVVSAEQAGGYRLAIAFSDGEQRLVDFERFLRLSRHPLIREYLKPEKFAKFRVEDGELIWDDYGLCFPIADLYENQI